MKTNTYWLLFMLVLFNISELKADSTFVSIPDTNFRAYLMSNYPSCFNTSDLMDTTCSPIVNLTTLDVEGQNIKDLTGIQYFKKLQYLYCDDNPLTNLSSLPDGLLNLVCGSSNLTNLPTLPAGLTDLDFTSAPISSLPTLPSNLQYLYCRSTNLTSIPALPSSMITVDARNSSLLTCLTSLNNNLESLSLAGTAVTCVPNIPTNPNFYSDTRIVQCSSYCTAAHDTTTNQSTFVTIPDANFRAYLMSNYPSCFNSSDEMDTTCSPIINLTTLDVENQNIKDLTGIQYFKKLQYLYCDDNPLTNLSSLPDGLLSLVCGSSNLTSLPTLPTGLTDLDFTSAPINSLPTLPSNLQYLYCRSTNLTSIPALPSSMITVDARNSSSLTCLTSLNNNLESLSLAGTAVTCVPNIPTNPNFYSDTRIVQCTSPCVASVTGVATATSTNDLSIYPNPSTGAITITSPSGQQLQSIKVISIDGRPVYESPTGTIGNQLSLDLSGQKVGLYFVQTTTGNQVINQKLIIE